jgi:signal transduction histidine kinase
VVELASGRVRLANPAAASLFGFAPIGEPVGNLLPGLVDAPAWQHLLRDHPAGDPRLWVAPASGLSVSLSCVDPRYVLVVVRQPTERDPHPSSVAPDQPLGSALAIQSFLDHATRALTSSLDYDTTLQAAARLAVPRLGDACLVDVLGEGQVIERAAAAHVDLADEARLFDLADSYPRDTSQQEPAFQGVLDATPRRVDDVSSWSSVAPDQAHAEVLEGLGLHSALLVPLVVRGRVLGAMLFAARDRARFADPAERFLAQDLARRCALAIDNARLFCSAQQAIAARDQFVSIAAHELRAPLSRLKSHAEVLLLQSEDRLDELGHERLVWSLRRINAAADRLAALTRDLLDVSRLRGGQLPFRPGPLDLGRLVSDLVPRFADQLDEDHPLRLDLAPEPSPVLVDQDRLEQVLCNLLDNAAKYSPAGGEIRVRLAPSEGGVLLAVEDQGVGLPPGSADVIFEPFGRASNAADCNVPGMGLGLHICRIIVERHAGRIWATSDGEGHGTTFWVWLPVAGRSPLPRGDVQDRLTNQLTVVIGYCELLASNPSLAPELRAQALEAMHGARQVAAVLESMPGVFRPSPPHPSA